MCENHRGPVQNQRVGICDGTDTTYTQLYNPSNNFDAESPIQVSERTRALRCDTWTTFFDGDGRVVNESALRKAIFKGGIDSKIRKEVWSFLFGLYPFSSTRTERQALVAENYAQYHAMKTRWKELVTAHRPLVKPDVPETSPLYLRECHFFNGEANVAKDYQESSELSGKAVETLGKDQKVFLNLTAKLNASRQAIDIGKLSSTIRGIDKDVPRTDRSHSFFKGKGNLHLLVLRDILITYSAYHQDVGYVQGMNDILSRFLIVMESEDQAYSCFVNYMESVKSDFLEDGMLTKIKDVRLLLNKMDEELFNHFDDHGMGDMLFVHRWLVLAFKREFSFDDALTMFEIISCQHLGLSSVEAERERKRQRAKERERDEGEFNVQVIDMNTNYSFEIFVCLAVLKEYRNKLLRCSEVSSVYNTINSLSMKMDLNVILMRAEELFFKYCRKSVTDCFQVVDMETIW